ncbi:acyltransferase family protein [Marinobacterium mangrovicola]|uniref:Peptidoglycan/LPS O-acetylase OafA/YrhL n=1 Tax=Marinobacterium mangrovicola TaxID=1476959 RepID=A0A4R1GSG3_9GAMM|nr:peptidoglycan/LPS O-acetylase OafA/YrhL [Marinobacterium mangrovicola]
MRYAHIDFLRAALMIGGIIVHSATLALQPSPFYSAIFYISSLFRMETFFIISGFLTALTCSKYGYSIAIKNRLIRIGIPLFFGLIILNPITNQLVYLYHNEGIEKYTLNLYFKNNHAANGPMVWHLHLWFLFPLIFYAFFLRPIDKLASNNFLKQYIKDLDDKNNIYIVILILSLATLSVLLRIFYTQIIVNFFNFEFSFLLREILYQFPYYLFGFILFKYKGAYKIFHTPSWCLFACLTTIVIVFNENNPFNNVFLKSAELMVYAITSYSIANILFYLSERSLPKHSNIISFYASASYTIYMMHYLVIYAIALSFKSFFENENIFIAFCAVITFIITTLIHKHMVSDKRILPIFLNGKI